MMQFVINRPPRRHLGWKISILVALVLSLLLSFYFFYLYSEIKQRFASRKWSIPARVFSATVPLYPGQSLSILQMKQMLEERRYQEAVREPLNAGEYKVGKGTLVVHFREFHFPGHTISSQRVELDFHQNKLNKMRGPKGELSFLELEPLEVARLFGPERVSRSLIDIQQVPRFLIDAVVAIEDHRFYEHGGVDWWGISRAVWADLRARRLVQGGSTITQQLVKNYFLEPERHLKRKLLEASMALIVDFCYSKDEILEMYMNEIYLGHRGNVAIHGMGEAARYYFGRNVEDLTLAESAMLAGMIQAPNHYAPAAHPDECLERRNTVLKRMSALGKISKLEYETAYGEPLRVAKSVLPVNVAPYFVDYVRQQLQELYAPEVLESEGLSIYTTLQPELALAAENAVKEGLDEIEKERTPQDSDPASKPLQAVLIAVQPKTGAVLALVGGRDYEESSLNSAYSAHREAGSAVLPFVYLSALDECTPTSPLSDEAATYTVGGAPWTPKNFDDRYRGPVTMRRALEESLNAATVDMAMKIGMEKVIAVIRSLGIVSPSRPDPTIALGEFDLTPLELAGAYAALSNDGQKPYLLSLKEVVTERGDIQEHRNMDFVSVTTPAKAYIITDFLRGAFEKGNEKTARRAGAGCQCSAQAGTTMDLRDSWFAGYTTDLLVLTWVGYDDGRPTGLSGSEGAARIWARFLNQVRPWIRAQPFRVPPGVVQRVVCGAGGSLATPYCPDKRLEIFLADHAPQDYCILHKRN